MDQGVPDVKEVLLPADAGAADPSAKMKERAAKEAELKKVCADFESIFIYTLLQKMRDTVPKSGLLTEMQGKGTYNAMIDQKVAEAMAKNGGMGLQTMLYDQISADFGRR